MNGTSSWKKRQGFDMKKMDGWMVTERIDSYERMGTVHLLKKKRQGFDEWYICLKIRFIKNVCVCVCVCVRVCLINGTSSYKKDGVRQMVHLQKRKY